MAGARVYGVCGVQVVVGEIAALEEVWYIQHQVNLQSWVLHSQYLTSPLSPSLHLPLASHRAKSGTYQAHSLPLHV